MKENEGLYNSGQISRGSSALLIVFPAGSDESCSLYLLRRFMEVYKKILSLGHGLIAVCSPSYNFKHHSRLEIVRAFSPGKEGMANVEANLPKPVVDT